MPAVYRTGLCTQAKMPYLVARDVIQDNIAHLIQALPEMNIAARAISQDETGRIHSSEREPSVRAIYAGILSTLYGITTAAVLTALLIGWLLRHLFTKYTGRNRRDNNQTAPPMVPRGAGAAPAAPLTPTPPMRPMVPRSAGAAPPSPFTPPSRPVN